MNTSSVFYVVIVFIMFIKHSDSMEEPNTSNKNITEHKNWDMLPKNCGRFGTRGRIVGGMEASQGQFPYLGRLGYSRNNNTKFLCASALITNNCVLTAAHCTKGYEKKLVLVRFGENSLTKNKDCDKGECLPFVQDKKPVKFINHPNYNPLILKNDIALIELDSPVTYNKFVQPICLPKSKLITRNSATESLIVAGWGYTDPGTSQLAEQLQYVSIPLRDRSACSAIYYYRQIDESQLCAGLSIGKDSCDGDSGGPLMNRMMWEGTIRAFALGIVSFGESHCGEEPSVYTNVPHFVMWILDSLDMVHKYPDKTNTTNNTNNTSNEDNTSNIINNKPTFRRRFMRRRPRYRGGFIL